MLCCAPTCVGLGPLEVRYPEKGNSLGVEYSAKLTKIKKSVRLFSINSYVKGLNYLRFINCIFAKREYSCTETVRKNMRFYRFYVLLIAN
jgi:hypothetical protein